MSEADLETFDLVPRQPGPLRDLLEVNPHIGIWLAGHPGIVSPGSERRHLAKTQECTEGMAAIVLHVVRTGRPRTASSYTMEGKISNFCGNWQK